jgi:hypothetical protein
MLFLNQKYGIQRVGHLIDYLVFNQKELYNDCNRQLPTNHAYVYYLDNGEVLVFPNGYLPKAEGLLLENKAILDEMLENDRFPIENPEKTIFEYERDALFTLPNIAYFKNHLDEKLNINEILDKTTIQKYYAGVLKWSKSKKALPLDFVALCVLFGELVRQEKGGQWVLLKRYGVFNPYFIPVFWRIIR